MAATVNYSLDATCPDPAPVNTFNAGIVSVRTSVGSVQGILNQIIQLPRADFDPTFTAQTPVKLIYVRSAGNDITGDGTLAKPYLTIDRAKKDIPTLLNGTSYVIDMSGYGTYTTATPLALQGFKGTRAANFPVETGFNSVGAVGIYAEPTVIDALNIPTANFVYDPISGLATITDTSKAWIVNEHKGRVFADRFGTDAINTGTIISNTATQLKVAASFVYLGRFGSTSSVILAPSCTINFTDPGSSFASALSIFDCDALVSVTGIHISGGATTYAGTISINASKVALKICDISGVAATDQSSVDISGCYVRSSVGTYANGDAGINMSGNCLLLIESSYLANISVFSVNPNCPPPIMRSTYVEDSDPVGIGFGDGSPGQSWYASNVEVTTAHGYGFYFYYGVQGRLISVNVSNSGGGVFVDRNQSVMLRGPIGGSGNTGYGVQIGAGAQVVTYGGGAFTITGALGDLKVGMHAPRTWAHYGTVAPILNENDVTGVGARCFEYGLQFNTGPAGMWAVSAIKTANGYVPRFWETVRVDPTAGAFGIVLPDPAGFAGQQIKAKNVSTSVNAVTFTSTGAKTFDGAASYVLNTANGLVRFESDGTNWMVV